MCELHTKTGKMNNIKNSQIIPEDITKLAVAQLSPERWAVGNP
jgi:hypothetical protein